MRKNIGLYNFNYTLILLLSLLVNRAMTQTVSTVSLYPDNQIPNSKTSVNKEIDDGRSVRKVSVPTITIYSPKAVDSSKTAVIVCPGGGYGGLAISHEGRDVAFALNELGITALVLKYRLPHDSIMVNKSTGPLQDVQQAIAYARMHATQLNIHPNKIGVMGFSAGGHLVSTAITRFNHPVIAFEVSVRPDFAALIYPVISFKDSVTHAGSRRNLLSPNINDSTIQYFSSELHVSPATPTSFLVHAEDDKAVPVENSLLFFQALRKNNVLASLNIYPKGGHGYGLNNKFTKDKWFNRFAIWLKDNGFLAAEAGK